MPLVTKTACEQESASKPVHAFYEKQHGFGVMKHRVTKQFQQRIQQRNAL